MDVFAIGRFGVDAVGAVASAGLDLAAIPLREGAKILTGEPSDLVANRRCWRGEHRAWIEVRGLDEPDTETAVLEAMRAQPGVTSVRINRPLSRVVVGIDDQVSLSELCTAIDAVEPGAGDGAALPGDGLLLAAKGAMLGANAAGLAIATVGSALRLPAAPKIVDAAAAVARYQPWVRRALESRLGPGRTDTVLSLVSLSAHVVTMSPSILAVDLMVEGLKAAEIHAGARAWERHEPVLARWADCPDGHSSARPVPAPIGPVERHLKRSALAQLAAAGVVGAITRNLAVTSDALLATSPKAVRTSVESFAATLGQGLAAEHGVLSLRPAALRRLDKVDAVLIDPRVLVGQALASALVLETRAARAELVTVDVDDLGELRPAFDELHPVDDGDIDAALAAAVAGLQRAGRTVAVLSTGAAAALAAADVALGLLPADDDTAAPFHADLLLADLAGAWHVLHALPAARDASERGVAIAIGASSIAGLRLVPGVRASIPGVPAGRSRGPGPVTIGAGAGMLSGYLLARRALRAPAPKPAPAHQWHAMTVEQVRELLVPAGGTVALAERAPIETVEPGTFWPFVHAVRAELSDPMTPILALCSAATAMLGSPIDAVMVGTVLTGNAMLAAYQRLNAENRLNTLLAQQTPPARLVLIGSDGVRTYHDIVAEALLPGDLIEVRSNEVVPADARLVDESDLEVDESSLTGESLSVGKNPQPTPGAELAERSCMLYTGTTVIAGTALALVTAVGADTQSRRATELASGDLAEIGLQHHLSQLVSRAFPVSAAGGAAVGALGLLRGGGLRQALGNSIAVAIAAVPEGMPLMATLAQHASSQRLTKYGALVRIPRSVEALGRVDVVCFDKTGTLSENRLRVTTVHPVGGCCDADVLGVAAQAAPAPEGAAHAHATDQAIVEGAAAAAGVRAWVQPDAHLPFRSGRAFSASVLGAELLVKGAPEVVLDACADATDEAAQTVADMAARGLRVIAVARGTLTAAQAKSVQADPDRIVERCASGLTLLGFLGLADTPRPEAPQLLADLAARGVDIRMITGDHPITATAIVAEMGLSVAADQVITGSEWNACSRKEQERMVAERVIFARMSPENKVQIVQTLERAGRVSAMVGDGANDAAAIRAATVGLGVVARGSDSAHATADVVLTDGKIGALVDAIDEGRRLWRGVQLAISGLLGGNAGEVIFSVIGTAITGNSPLNTRQLLLMNTLTDALPATAVAVSTPAGPIGGAVRGLDEQKLWRSVRFRGGVTAAAGTAAWAMASLSGLTVCSARASTVALIALVSTELGQTVVDSRAPLVLATAAGSFVAFAAMISTPGVSQLLGCTPVGPIGWAQGVGSAAAATAAVAVAGRLSAGGPDPAPRTPELGAVVEAPVLTVVPVVEAPAKKAAVKKAPVVKAAVKKVPVVKAAVAKAPAKKAAVAKTPAKKTPAKKAPVKKAAAAKVPAKKVAATKASPKLELVRD